MDDCVCFQNAAIDYHKSMHVFSFIRHLTQKPSSKSFLILGHILSSKSSLAVYLFESCFDNEVEASSIVFCSARKT